MRNAKTCTIEGCDRKHYSGGMCSMHRQRWRKRGNVGDSLPERWGNRACTVQGCKRAHRARGWCSMHYKRWKAHGDPNVALKVHREPAGIPQSSGELCAVEDCGGDLHQRGLCNMHYLRWYRNGDVNATRKAPNNSPKVTYHGAHSRINRTRGAASGYSCVDCGSAAREWSYTHDCPIERAQECKSPHSGMIEMSYCPCPDSAHYDPRCKSCHARFDAA